MTFLGSRGGAMEGLYGAFGNPTTEDRTRMYAAQTGALQGQIGRAMGDVRRDAMGVASSASAGGNPFLAGRVGAHAASDAASRVASSGLTQQAQLSAQQQAQELQARQQQGQWAQHMIGGLLGAGGQVLGMAIPAFGALRGAAGASGVTGALGSSGNPMGQMLGSALGGPSGGPTAAPAAPAAPAPTAAPTPSVGIGSGGFTTSGTVAPPGMRWDPIGNRWVPAASAGTIGGSPVAWGG